MTERGAKSPRELGIEICKEIHYRLKELSAALMGASTDDEINTAIQSSQRWTPVDDPYDDPYDAWPATYSTLMNGLVGLHLLATYGHIPRNLVPRYEQPARTITSCLFNLTPPNEERRSELKAVWFAFRLFLELLPDARGQVPDTALPDSWETDQANDRNAFAQALVLIAFPRWAALQVTHASVRGYAKFLSSEVKIQEFVLALQLNSRGSVIEKRWQLNEEEKKEREQEQVRNWLRSFGLSAPPIDRGNLKQFLKDAPVQLAQSGLVRYAGLDKLISTYDDVKSSGFLATRLRRQIKLVFDPELTPIQSVEQLISTERVSRTP